MNCKKETKYLIYKATNNITGKIYVGQTRQLLRERKWDHEYEAYKKPNKNNYFHLALAKYGKENFTWEVVEEVSSLEELNEREVFWIRELHSLYTEGGYNLEGGGHANKEIPKCTRQKLRNLYLGKYEKENNPNWGHKWSQAKKLALSNKFREERDYSCSKNPNSKKCSFYNIETNQIEVYGSRMEFCQKYSIKYDTAEQNSKAHKIIGKKFVEVGPDVENLQTFVEEIKQKSRWYKRKT